MSLRVSSCNRLALVWAGSVAARAGTSQRLPAQGRLLSLGLSGFQQVFEQ